MSRSAERAVLVLGRGLHPPWNEGTRVVGRATGEVAARLRPTTVLSLTASEFRDEAGGDGIEHVFTDRGYGPVGEWASMPRIAARVRELHERERFAVAHVVGLPLALAPFLRRLGMRVVAHVTLSEHVYAGRLEALRAEAAWRVFDRWVDAYAATGRTVVESLRARGLDPRKLHLLPPPIDTEAFHPLPPTEAREAAGLPQAGFGLAYVGTISPLRFPAPVIAEALAAADDVPGLALDAFAPVRTHPYNTAWASNVSRTVNGGPPLRVHLEDLDDRRKAAVFSAADAVLVPFSAAVAVEPPLTLLEAMACGAAVVVSPQANRSALVRDGRTGVTYAGPDELAARLRELAAMGPEARRALGARARLEVERRHGHEAVAQALRDLWTASGVA